MFRREKTGWRTMQTPIFMGASLNQADQEADGLAAVMNFGSELDANSSIASHGVVASDDLLQTAARLKVVLRPHGKIVAVTGLDVRDGGARLAAGLGAAMAALDNDRVLVMDANVRAPELHEAFGIPRTPGLFDALDGKADLKLALRCVGPSNLFVLPIGESTETMGSMLTSPEGAGVMKTIREQFRNVIVDAGLIHSAAEGMLFASMCDGVIVALAVGIRRRDEILAFQEQLGRLKIPLLGVVLTRAA